MQNSDTPRWDMLCSVNTELQKAREKLVKHQNQILSMLDMDLNTQQILEEHTDLELLKEVLKPIVNLVKELEDVKQGEPVIVKQVGRFQDLINGGYFFKVFLTRGYFLRYNKEKQGFCDIMSIYQHKMCLPKENVYKCPKNINISLKEMDDMYNAFDVFLEVLGYSGEDIFNEFITLCDKLDILKELENAI